jgi:hypothetical protein
MGFMKTVMNLTNETWYCYLGDKKVFWSGDCDYIFSIFFKSLDDFRQVIHLNDKLNWEIALMSASIGLPTKLLKHSVSIGADQYVCLEQEIFPMVENGVVKGVEGRIRKISII